MLCCGNTHRREPRARSRHESALYPYLRYPHNACHIYRVCAGSAACGRQQGRGKASMQDAFAVRRMTCCSAFTAEKIGEKCFPDGKRRPFLLCCGNTHRQEPSARPRQASGAYVLIFLCVKEFLRAQVRRFAGGVCLSDATTKKRRPRQEAEDLLLTMRLDGHQVKIAYTAEPCCRSHCIPYSIFRQPFSLFDHSPIFRMTGGSARCAAISICSYRQVLEGHRSRGSCRYAAKKQEPK